MTRIVIDTEKEKSKISKHIYGQFSEHLGRCIYEGIYVGEDSDIPHVKGLRKDVVEALKKIKVPVLRWPGGCFADEYHWKDGIGEKANRKHMVNNNWGGTVEDNSFGTHEFMELCRQIECEPYINGNVGSGTVAEMQEWIEYMTSDADSPMTRLRKENGQEEPWSVKYFGIGNENWGGGGNMSADYYSQEYKRYATFSRNYGDNQLYKIACGSGAGDGVSGLKLEWTDTMMKNLQQEGPGRFLADGYSLHYYTIPGPSFFDKGSATGFTVSEYYETLSKASWLDSIIRSHAAVMERHDPEHKVKIIFDEWGTWYDVEEGTNPGFLYQQNTMRDALVASISLDIFNKHSDIVHMANIAQAVNVLQAMLLTDQEKLVSTPTYYVFQLYASHQEGTLLESFQTAKQVKTQEMITRANGNSYSACQYPEGFQLEEISHSASKSENGNIVVTVSNIYHDKEAELELDLLSGRYELSSARILTGEMGDYNDFEHPDLLKLGDFKEGVHINQNEMGTIVKVTLPRCSVGALEFMPKNP